MPLRARSVSSGPPRMAHAVAEARPGTRWAIWNAWALSYSNAGFRNAKVEFVRKLAAKTVFLMLQETRAREYGLRQVLRPTENSHWILASGESDSAGGVAILVAKTVSRTTPTVVEHIRGRIMEVQLRFDVAELALICIHNYDVGSAEMRRFASVLHSLADAHGQAPMHKRAILIGDVNFGVGQVGVSGAARRRTDRTLASALARWVELPVLGATHVSADRCSFSGIDRAWALLPRSMMAVARPRACISAQPERMLSEGLSDHAPVLVEWPRRCALPLDRRLVTWVVAEDHEGGAGEAARVLVPRVGDHFPGSGRALAHAPAAAS